MVRQAVAVAGACGFTICAGARFVTSFLSRIAKEAFARNPPDLLVILCRVAPRALEKAKRGSEQSAQPYTEARQMVTTQSVVAADHSGQGPVGFRPLLCGIPALSSASALDELVLNELSRQRKAEAQNLVAAQEADVHAVAVLE